MLLAVLLWFWIVGVGMAVGRISFEDGVPQWQRVAIWAMWPATFPIVMKMMASGEISE